MGSREIIKASGTINISCLTALLRKAKIQSGENSPHSKMAEPLRIMFLHALAYCERLFYLEEVEEMRMADERVYAGRRLHVQIDKKEAQRARKGNVVAQAVSVRKKRRVKAVNESPAPWETEPEEQSTNVVLGRTEALETYTAGGTPALQSKG